MAEESSFQFEGFFISKSSFQLNKDSENPELSVDFSPSGRLDMNSGIFHLNMGVIISDPSEIVKIEIEATGIFKFDNFQEEELKPYLYQNAPAILFPYIRAYISSLTTLSGIQPIVLPTFNLSDLKDELEKNIVRTASGG